MMAHLFGSQARIYADKQHSRTRNQYIAQRHAMTNLSDRVARSQRARNSHAAWLWRDTDEKMNPRWMRD